MLSVRLCVATATAAFAISTAAQADVRYAFVATKDVSGRTGSFTYTAPNFITSDFSIPLGQTDSCQVIDPNISNICSAGFLYPLNGLPGIDTQAPDSVIFGFVPQHVYQFSSYDLTHFGSYKATVPSFFGFDNEATLTVSYIPSVAAAVPETGTWSMMMLGFGTLGSALRTLCKRESRLSQQLTSTIA